MRRQRILVVFAVAASFLVSCAPKTGKSTKVEMEQTEKNQQRLVKVVPPPILKDSIERRNLKRRLELFNNPNKVSYIYLINYGKVMAFYIIKGKVSYAGSKLTTRDQLVAGRTQGDLYVIESPGLDGSYGPSEDSVFFWTTNDVYVEWRGDYMLCDQPLKLTTPPQLIREITD